MARMLILGGALLLLASARAEAGGFGIPEIGVRRTGMASIIGRPDDPSAIYHNPGGLVLEPGLNLYVSSGLSLLDTQFELSPWSDTLPNGQTVSSNDILHAQPGASGRYAPIKPTRAFGVIPMIAATYELLHDRVWLGAGIYVGNATGAKFDRNSVARYHLIDGYIIAPQAVLSVAVRIAPSISVGLTGGVLNMRVHGERLFYPILRNANGTASDVRPVTGSAADLTLDGEAWAPTAVAGVFGQPHPKITWGATVTMRTDATLAGNVKVVESADAPVQNTLHGTQTTTQLLPWAFMAGANFDVAPNVEIGTEVRYWLYRQYKEQDTEIKHIDLIDHLTTVKNYGDSWETSGGVRVHGLAFCPTLDLMAGMQYDHSPAPADTVTLDQPSFSHVGLHSGARYTFGSGGRYRVGASYIHYIYFIPTVTDSITAPPTNFTGKGANNIITASLEVRI